MFSHIEEGAGNVASAVAEEQNGVGDDFLGMSCPPISYVSPVYISLAMTSLGTEHTSCVCNLHTQNKHKRGVVWTGQIVADQATDALIKWYKPQPERSGQVWDEKNEHKDATSILKAIVQVNAHQNRDGNEDPIRNLSQVSV